MRRSRYKRGDYNAICDVSGFKYKRSQMKKTWDGLLVGREWWDPKHPQLNIRARSETKAVPDASPRSDTIKMQDDPALYATLIDSQGGEVKIARQDALIDSNGNKVTPEATLTDSDGNEVEVFTQYVGGGLGNAFTASDLI